MRWLAVVCVAARAAELDAPAPAPVAHDRTASTWDAFWSAHGVSPTPPTELFAPMPPDIDVVNLTRGEISDDEARRWVMADLRRGNADAWALTHLRDDLVNATVLGPPGLSGDARHIRDLRAKGVVGIELPMRGTVAIAGVIAVSDEMRKRRGGAGLSRYVIVLVYQATGLGGDYVFADGHREHNAGRPAGTLTWQLDTGELRDDPAIGPLWFQQHGWTCAPGRRDVVDELCALVQPKSAARDSDPP